MSGLPRGWSATTIAEIAEISAGFGFPKHLQGKTTGRYPFAKVGDISTAVRIADGQLLYAENFVDDSDLAVLRARPVPEGSTVFAKIGEALKLNRRALTKTQIILDNNCMAVSPLAGVYAEFLFTFMKTVDLGPLSIATTVPSVRKGDVGSIKLALPPKEEQRRIALKLNALDARSRRASRELHRIPILIERYKRAILAKAFSGELTADWRDQLRMQGGDIARLSSAAEAFSYGSSAKSSPEGLVPVLRMGNIQDGKLDWTDLVYTSDVDEIQKYRLQPGDVLFNRTNSPELVGKTALFVGGREAIYAGYLIKIRCTERLLPSFLTYCLNSPQGRHYCWRVKTDGVSQSNINAKKLAAFEFLLPGINEQTEIVRRIDSAFAWLDKIATEYARAAHLVPKLDQAILAKAFRGELVPQDPNDEPAAELLQRIRAAQKADRPRRGRGARR
jgi:type I restriction enzyme S subunit